MFGCLRWLLVGAIAVLPVTVDLRRGSIWSEASAQDIWSLNCDPVKLCGAHVCALGSLHLGGQARLWFAPAK